MEDNRENGRDNRETQAIEKMEGQSRMDNRETQAIEKMEGTIERHKQ